MSNLLITIAGIAFIFIMTTLGAALVYIFKDKISNRFNTIFLGFASGIMIAASIWSLIIPAIEQSENLGIFRCLPVAIGFILGGIFLVTIDKCIPHVHKVQNKKNFKLFISVLIHNIPEGLAVGFAFGAAFILKERADFLTALGLAIGIGIQNFPEGAAVSLPMKKDFGSNNKSFLFGFLSGVVEPIFAIIGLFMASKLEFLMPWLLSFAAGAMIFVVIEDLIPESQVDDKPHLGTWSAMVGFLIMMVLDVMLG